MGPILYVTDLHGSRWKYERTFALAREVDAAAVVNGGDMFPHGRDPEAQCRFIREYLDGHLAAYEKAGIRYFGIPGNDDLRIHDPEFDEICGKYSLSANLARRKVSFGGYDFIGLDLVTDFPFRLKDRARMDVRDYVFPHQFGGAILSVPGGFEEVPDWPTFARTLPTIEEELHALPAPRDPSKTVYVLHGPPAGLGLDVVRGGAAVGSRATLSFLERMQPLVSFHGHIHESPEESGLWKNGVGRTVCLQPGQSANGLTVVIANLETMTFARRVLSP